MPYRNNNGFNISEHMSTKHKHDKNVKPRAEIQLPKPSAPSMAFAIKILIHAVSGEFRS